MPPLCLHSSVSVASEDVRSYMLIINSETETVGFQHTSLFLLPLFSPNYLSHDCLRLSKKGHPLVTFSAFDHIRPSFILRNLAYLAKGFFFIYFFLSPICIVIFNKLLDARDAAHSPDGVHGQNKQHKRINRLRSWNRWLVPWSVDRVIYDAIRGMDFVSDSILAALFRR